MPEFRATDKLSGLLIHGHYKINGSNIEGHFQFADPDKWAEFGTDPSLANTERLLDLDGVGLVTVQEVSWSRSPFVPVKFAGIIHELGPSLMRRLSRPRFPPDTPPE